MALSRAEIELLIKARSDADKTFKALGEQIKGVTGESEKASRGLGVVGDRTRTSGVQATAAGVAFGILAERLARGLVGAFNSTIAAANRLDAGLIGLRSVATAFQQDAGRAEGAAKSLAADGLLSVGSAATGLKNLLAAGFGLDQAVTLMNRFKDSAAFGRQGALDFGQAIVGATEGIKNGNSTLVDNAGVTKNLSVILTEAGFAASDLSKAQSDLGVRTALFNGILKETNPQLGDAARFLDTAAGRQAAFSAQVEIAQQKIGKALQPALASTLQTLTPFIAAVGNNADALVPLATAVAAVVVPLGAMRAAAALGIPSLASLGAKAIDAASIFGRAYDKTGSLSGALGLLGRASGVTVRELGLLKSAGLAAGAAFVGWQIGRFIAELTGADQAIQRLTVRLGIFRDLQAETAGAKQDTINRAIALGAQANISYADAIEYVNQRMTAQLQLQQSEFGQRRQQIETKVKLGELTRAQADDLLILIQAEESRANRAKNTTGLEQIAAQQRAALNAETIKLGLSLDDLAQRSVENEAAFEAWAKQMGLSDLLLDQVKERVKGLAKESKDAAKDTKALEAEQRKLHDALESTAGVLTQRGLNDQLKELDTLLKLASGQGSPALATAVRNLHDEFQELRQKAIDSGLAVEAIDGLFQRAATSSGVLLQGVRQFGLDAPAAFSTTTEANGDLVDGVHAGIRAQRDLADAYKFFGLTSRAELQKAAQEAERYYGVLLSSGNATTDQLTAAYREMIDAQRALTGQLPSAWDETAGRIRGILGGLHRDITGNLSSLLFGLGHDMDGSLRRTADEATRTYLQIKADGTATPEQIASAFRSMQEAVDRANYTMGERFEDVWQRIKTSLFKVFDEILGTFVNGLLKGMLGALNGQQGAFSQAFGGLLGGGGGGGGVPGVGGIPGLGGLFGGGGASAGAFVPGVWGTGLPGGASAGAGAGIGAAGLIGGVGAGAAGFSLGQLAQRWTGGAGWAAGGIGAGSGAASGALIGSVVPGIGTAVGAGIGALAGLIGGWLGQSQGEKTNDVRDQFIGQFGGSGTGEGSGFNTLAVMLSKLSPEAGGGAGGGDLFQRLIKADKVEDLQAAITAVVTALQQAETETAELGATTDQTAATAEERYKVTTAQLAVAATEAERLKTEIARVGKEGGDTSGLEEELEHLQRKIQVITEEAGFFEGSLEDAGEQEDGVRILTRQTEHLRNALEGARIEAGRLGLAIGDLPQMPGGLPGRPVEGGAAGGVYASRPGLVLFGEGGQPEVGGPRSFFKEVFAELGVGTRGASASGGAGVTVVPLAVIVGGANGVDFAAIDRHLVSAAGISGNSFGLRELIESIAGDVVRRERARA